MSKKNKPDVEPKPLDCPSGYVYDPDTHQCVRPRKEQPDILESKAAKELLKKAKHTKTAEYVKGTREQITPPERPERVSYKRAPKIEKCPSGYEYNTELQRCVKVAGLQEQVPVRPVTDVGPVTVEQRMDSIEETIHELKMQIANILGMLGQREGKQG